MVLCGCQKYVFSESKTFGTKEPEKMNKVEFPKSIQVVFKYTTFFYGMCSEDKLIELIKAAEADGCEFVQLMSGLIPAPPSAVALPGARPAPIPVLRLLVRMPDDAYAELLKKKGSGSTLIH